MVDELNTPGHRWYQPRYHVPLAKNDVSKKYIYASGIRKIDDKIIRQALFASSEPGAWYDPSDLSTMFQDSAGTIPVTAVGQPVGLRLDKSKGLVQGGELFSNQPSVLDNSGGAATVTHTASTRTVQVTVAGSNTSYPRLQVSVGAVSGRRYVVSGRIDGDRSLVSGVRFAITGSVNSLSYNASTGVFSGIQEAGATPIVEIQVNGTLLGTVTIATLSVKELPGNHASQSTPGSRAIYASVPKGGRRNLLTYSEDLTNAIWSKSSTTVASTTDIDPLGSVVSLVTVSGATDALDALSQAVTVPSGATVAFSFVLKRGSHDWVRLTIFNGANAVRAWFNLSTGAIGTRNVVGTGVLSGATISSLGGGYYRCMLAGSIPATTSYILAVASAVGDASFTRVAVGSTRYQSAHQLDVAATTTNYQRVGSIYDITEAGVQTLYGLLYDGLDDFYVTPTITPGVDKVQVFAGVRKLSSGPTGSLFLETSTDSSTNAGALYLLTFSDEKYYFRSGGSSRIQVASEVLSPPVTNVLTGIGDISGDRATLRVDGTQVAQSTADQGTGNFLAYPLYIGRRGGTSLPYNGYEFGLIVRFGPNLSEAQIASTEAWLNTRTGAY